MHAKISNSLEKDFLLIGEITASVLNHLQNGSMILRLLLYAPQFTYWKSRGLKQINIFNNGFISTRVLQRNRTNKVCVRVCVCIYMGAHAEIPVSVCVCGQKQKQILRNLFYTIGSHDCGDQQVHNLMNRPADRRPKEEMMLQLKSKGRLKAKFILIALNLLLRPSTDWIRHTHIIDSNNLLIQVLISPKKILSQQYPGGCLTKYGY